MEVGIPSQDELSQLHTISPDNRELGAFSNKDEINNKWLGSV